jgi:hypothetical protein
MWTSDNPKLLLFSISGLLTTAFVNAQNSSCQSNSREFRTVNSTGQHEFTWDSSYASDDPWYVSVLVGSRGTEWKDSHDVSAEAYISVPGNVSNGTKICSYQYDNINATLESGGVNSCSGVISSGCIDHLTNALTKSEYYCPGSDIGSTSEAFNKACPMLKGGSHSTFLPLSLYKASSVLSFFSPTELILLTGVSGSAAFVHLANKFVQASSLSMWPTAHAATLTCPSCRSPTSTTRSGQSEASKCTIPTPMPMRTRRMIS